MRSKLLRIVTAHEYPSLASLEVAASAAASAGAMPLKPKP
jgi:hypothetical protein